jgi:hypothetical protein
MLRPTTSSHNAAGCAGRSRHLAAARLVACLAAAWCCAAAAANRPRPPCWIAEAGDGRAFLMAGVHVGTAKDAPLASAVEEAYAEADRVLVEVDPQRLRGAEFQAAVLEKGMLPPGSNLETFLGQDSYAEVEEMLVKLEMPTAFFRRMKPGLVYSTCTFMMLAKLSQEPRFGSESYLVGKARRDGKEVLEAETIEEQLELIIGDKVDQGRLLLLETARAIDDYEAETRKLLAYWREGDTESLEMLLFDPEEMAREEIRELYETVFFQRNSRMAARIGAELAKGGNCFVVFGAGHFIGDRGIPALLRQAPGVGIRRVQLPVEPHPPDRNE